MGRKIFLSLFQVSSILLIFTWSAVQPYDYLTWILEVAPVVIGVSLLIVTYRRFKFTELAYWLIWIHAVILMVGGHYTYARMPLFDWLKELLNLSRNHYDRLGHLAQGFVPAIITMEVLIRKSPLAKSRWLFFLVVSVCLAISAFYELIEWWVALAAGFAAEDFLATQGDVWDTQSDMFLALIGAVISLAFFRKIHDEQLADIGIIKND